MKKTLGAVFAALLGLSILAMGSVAQDASPSASPGACPMGSAEENLQIVHDYFDAVLSGDMETADELLHDDMTHNLSVEGAEVTNDAGNDDELENIDVAGNANVEITHSIAQGEWVAVYFNFDVSGEEVEGAAADSTANINAMGMVRVECGMIAEALLEFDALELLQELGFEIMPAEGQ